MGFANVRAGRAQLQFAPTARLMSELSVSTASHLTRGSVRARTCGQARDYTRAQPYYLLEVVISRYSMYAGTRRFTCKATTST